MYISNDRKSRVVIFAVISVLSLFLLGAGMVAGNDEKQTERQQMTAVVSAMSSQIPEQYQDSWRDVAAKNPQFLLALSTEKLEYGLNSK